LKRGEGKDWLLIKKGDSFASPGWRIESALTPARLSALPRAAGQAQGVFVVGLFFLGYFEWLFYAMIALSALAYAEEILLLCLLPTWKSDVRGLYWVFSSKRGKGQSDQPLPGR